MKKFGVSKVFLAILIYILVVAFCLIGWVMGLIRFMECDFDPVGKAEIIYGIGIITGLNSIFGWFNFGR